MTNKIQIAVSSCLLGERVRYDGGHKNNPYIVDTLGNYFDFKPFCPEMSIGLGVPREPIQLVKLADQVRCLGVKEPTLDVTERLTQCAHEQRSWQNDISGYILKKGSPSCGMEKVKIYHQGIPATNGNGVYAKQMMENFPALPVEEEGRLGDPRLRENFISRVFIYHRCKQLETEGLNWQKINDFHARHKLILMSHNQNQCRELGNLLSRCSGEQVEQFWPQYVLRLMAILKIVASRRNHVNVLQHIQGYLKKQLDGEDKKELSDAIEQYRLGHLPLIVPITLLRHHFRKFPVPYIENSYYMNPHPQKLMLLNNL